MELSVRHKRRVCLDVRVYRREENCTRSDRRGTKDDLFVVPSVTFELLYAFIIVRLARRDLVWINVTSHPTADRYSTAIHLQGKTHSTRAPLACDRRRPPQTEAVYRNNEALGLGKSGHIRHDCAT